MLAGTLMIEAELCLINFRLDGMTGAYASGTRLSHQPFKPQTHCHNVLGGKPCRERRNQQAFRSYHCRGHSFLILTPVRQHRCCGDEAVGVSVLSLINMQSASWSIHAHKNTDTHAWKLSAWFCSKLTCKKMSVLNQGGVLSIKRRPGDFPEV